MSRYILFSGASYYPGGGMEDFFDSFDTVEEALEWGRKIRRAGGWSHVLDRQTGLLAYITRKGALDQDGWQPLTPQEEVR